MTAGMMDLLRRLYREGGLCAGTDNGNVARLKGLQRRGYVERPDRPGGRWHITQAGIAFVKEREQL